MEDGKLVLSGDISSQAKKTEPEEGKYLDWNKENLVETKGIKDKKHSEDKTEEENILNEGET